MTLIELKHSGVSSTQTVVRIDQTGDLVVGDLVHYKAHAWLEGGIVGGKPRPDLQAWRRALAELPGLTPQPERARLYGGRGQVGSVNAAVAFQRDYLSQADRLVTEYLRTAPVAELKDPAKAQKHYAELQGRFERALPDLALPYLVGYGVYGLVNSKLD